MQKPRRKSSLNTHLETHFKQLMSFLERRKPSPVETNCTIGHLVSLSPLNPGRDHETLFQEKQRTHLWKRPSVSSPEIEICRFLPLLPCIIRGSTQKMNQGYCNQIIWMSMFIQNITGIVTEELQSSRWELPQ